MRKIKKAVSLLLTGILAASGVTAVSAANVGELTALPLLRRDGTSTAVTYTNGTKKTYEGVIDASRLEGWSGVSSIASYTVSGGGKELFSVALNDIAPDDAAVGSSTQKINGYYAIDFTFPGSEHEAFITGLSPYNLERTQNAIVDSFVCGEELSVEDFEYIDVEKTAFAHDDDYLCWAAAASNSLYYAGWLEPAGFCDSDDVFEEFIDSFTDDGGDVDIGCGWFLNGVYYNPALDTAKLKKTGTGAYMPEYPCEMITERYICAMIPSGESSFCSSA